MENPTNAPTQYPGEILRCIVGSEVIGINKPGISDVDLMGVCIEAPTFITGLGHFEQHHFRTQPEGVRSGPGDIDCTIYGLRKFMHLAADKANPTVLTLFFVPPEFRVFDEPMAEAFRQIAPYVISRRCASSFKGYMKAQKERLMGERGGAHVNRPELVEKYGFDTKYANHVVRLGLQGVEVLTTGEMQLPMTEEHRSLIQAIRHGKIALGDIIELANDLEDQLEALKTTSQLREHPHYGYINGFLFNTYQNHWSATHE